jgi:hypothetical protein
MQWPLRANASKRKTIGKGMRGGGINPKQIISQQTQSSFSALSAPLRDSFLRSAKNKIRAETRRARRGIRENKDFLPRIAQNSRMADLFFPIYGHPSHILIFKLNRSFEPPFVQTHRGAGIAGQVRVPPPGLRETLVRLRENRRQRIQQMGRQNRPSRIGQFHHFHFKIA